MEFSRQEYWGGLPFPSPGPLPNPGFEPGSPTLQADTLPPEPPGKPLYISVCVCVCVCRHIYMYKGMCVWAKSPELCPTLCDPMDYSLPDPSAHGILQARKLKWVDVPSSMGSSQSRDQAHVSYVSALAGKFFTTSTTWEASIMMKMSPGNRDCWLDYYTARTKSGHVHPAS